MKWISLFAILLLTSACASKFYIPANRFLSPENAGDTLKGAVKIGSASVTQVQVADDMTSANPDLTPVLSRNSSVYIGGELGLVNKLDVYFNGVASAPSFAGVKIQLLGEPVSTAKAGNFSLALLGGAGFGSPNMTSDSGGNKGETKMKFNGWEAGVLLGYRFADTFLMYAGPFKTNMQTKSQILRTANDVTTTTAEPDGKGEVNGVNLGLRFGQSLFFTVEGAYSHNKWTREQPSVLEAEELNSLTVGFVLGGAW